MKEQLSALVLPSTVFKEAAHPSLLLLLLDTICMLLQVLLMEIPSGDIVLLSCSLYKLLSALKSLSTNVVSPKAVRLLIFTSDSAFPKLLHGYLIRSESLLASSLTELAGA